MTPVVVLGVLKGRDRLLPTFDGGVTGKRLRNMSVAKTLLDDAEVDVAARDLPDARNKNVKPLKRLVLDALMRYYRFLGELLANRRVTMVTSGQIAAALEIDATQVRKDFAAIGLTGTGRVGFDGREVCRAVRVALGLDQKHEAVLIGTGYFGEVLLAYSGFARYGLHIMAAFDNDRHATGSRVAGYTVRPMREMMAFVKKHRIRLVILAPPTEISEQLLDQTRLGRRAGDLELQSDAYGGAAGRPRPQRAAFFHRPVGNRLPPQALGGLLWASTTARAIRAVREGKTLWNL